TSPGGADRGRGELSRRVTQTDPRRGVCRGRAAFRPAGACFLADPAAVAGLGVAGSQLFSALVIRPASATPESMRAAIRSVIGEATVRKGRGKLDIPAPGGNGHTGPAAGGGEGLMAAAGHAERI